MVVVVALITTELTVVAVAAVAEQKVLVSVPQYRRAVLVVPLVADSLEQLVQPPRTVPLLAAVQVETVVQPLQPPQLT
jgi:hypothetical protein